MKQGQCLRIYLSESEKIDGTPALEAILLLCQQAGLHGISVVRGIAGVGHHGMHSSSFLALSSHLPLLIEAIDDDEKILHAIAIIKPKLKGDLIATWPVQIIQPNQA